MWEVKRWKAEVFNIQDFSGAGNLLSAISFSPFNPSQEKGCRSNQGYEQKYLLNMQIHEV